MKRIEQKKWKKNKKKKKKWRKVKHIFICMKFNDTKISTTFNIFFVLCVSCGPFNIYTHVILRLLQAQDWVDDGGKNAKCEFVEVQKKRKEIFRIINCRLTKKMNCYEIITNTYDGMCERMHNTRVREVSGKIKKMRMLNKCLWLMNPWLEW